MPLLVDTTTHFHLRMRTKVCLLSIGVEAAAWFDVRVVLTDLDGFATVSFPLPTDHARLLFLMQSLWRKSLIT